MSCIFCSVFFFIKHQHSFEMLSIAWRWLGEFCRYLLSGEGESTARDCLSRSGLDDSAGPLTITNAHNASAASQDQTTVRPALF